MTLAEQYPNCLICPIVENPPVQDLAFRVHEGANWLVTLGQDQSPGPGRSYVTCKEHVEGIGDVPDDAWLELKDIIERMDAATKAGLGVTHSNTQFLMSDAYHGMRDDPSFVPQPHVHAHYRTRILRPVEIGGVIFTDPEFGGFVSTYRPNLVSLEVGKLIVARIQAHWPRTL